jgi:hypothetical protein
VTLLSRLSYPCSTSRIRSKGPSRQPHYLHLLFPHAKPLFPCREQVGTAGPGSRKVRDRVPSMQCARNRPDHLPCARQPLDALHASPPFKPATIVAPRSLAIKRASNRALAPTPSPPLRWPKPTTPLQGGTRERIRGGGSTPLQGGVAIGGGGDAIDLTQSARHGFRITRHQPSAAPPS